MPNDRCGESQRPRRLDPQLEEIYINRKTGTTRWVHPASLSPGSSTSSFPPCGQSAPEHSLSVHALKPGNVNAAVLKHL